MPGNSDGSRELEATGRDLPWFRCWWKDEMAMSDGWPLNAKGLFHELLSLQWRRGSLPANPEEIRKLLSVKPALWRATWAFVHPLFPVCDDGCRRNARQDHDLTEARHKVALNRKSGSLGGQRSAEKRRASAAGNVYPHPGRGAQK